MIFKTKFKIDLMLFNNNNQSRENFYLNKSCCTFRRPMGSLQQDLAVHNEYAYANKLKHPNVTTTDEWLKLAENHATYKEYQKFNQTPPLEDPLQITSTHNRPLPDDPLSEPIFKDFKDGFFKQTLSREKLFDFYDDNSFGELITFYTGQGLSPLDTFYLDCLCDGGCPEIFLTKTVLLYLIKNLNTCSFHTIMSLYTCKVDLCQLLSLIDSPTYPMDYSKYSYSGTRLAHDDYRYIEKLAFSVCDTLNTQTDTASHTLLRELLKNSETILRGMNVDLAERRGYKRKRGEEDNQGPDRGYKKRKTSHD